MKKVIDGKLYNTESARRLAYNSTGTGRTDFSFFEEILYKTKSGQYFLYGYGGPLSRYAENCGQNSWGWGEQIIPVDADAAKSWSEENLSGEEYISIWGEPEEA